ncbi:hypothetical protein [Pararhizobium arenae]|uniref:hypothetical protein n=1 Tax=Pararhizobium arenae TaxID=1856850 RepID=UPI00094B34B9|nr:hypothetical protein [Pararhizobium arenae]
MKECDLYRLSQFRVKEFTAEPPLVNLLARPVFAGPDAAIEVIGETVNGFVNGQPSHPTGQLARFIERYRDKIVAAAKSYQAEKTQKIVFAGTWHHIDFDATPRFEGCLTHVIAEDQAVVSTIYNERIFEWDDEPNRAGYGVGKTLIGGLDKIAASLHLSAERAASEQRGQYKGTSGLGMVGGMIWSADRDGTMPILFSPVTAATEVGSEFEEDDEGFLAGQPIIGDGSLSAAIMSKFREIETDGGWFRGKDVDRASHRPRKLKLAEAAEALDVIGYWVQVRSCGRPTSSHFRFFGASTEWPHEVLERSDNIDEDDFLGNRYASDWIYEPTHEAPDQEVRLLLLGPLPPLSLAPL